ncbi:MULTISPECIES: archaea-specific SMC-related protein [Salinibaculum]|uniref:archaea-specific SMC-related protein n=1 Tax=Salinibaculum TaxID=2732368 RepID=UPI0030CB541E
MALKLTENSRGQLTVENIGGIKQATVEFEPGVTILEGRNATNRTSFLQSVMAAVGSDDVSIKGDADEAHIELQLGDDTYERNLTKQSGAVIAEGQPYAEDPELAELFAFLLESNKARQAVARGDNLRELIMEPVDTDEIQAEIDRLVTKRSELKREIEEIDEQKRNLSDLEEQRQGLEDQVKEKKTELEEKEAELEAVDTNVQEKRQVKDELETKLEELRSKRSDIDDVRYDLDTERESLEQLKQERTEISEALDELSETPAGAIADIDAQLDTLRQRKQRIEAEINELQNVIKFNEEMLDESELAAFEPDNNDAELTDQLLEDDTVACWTCGSEVEADQIEATIDQLRERSQSEVSKLNDIEGEIDELQAERSELEQTQRKRDNLDRRRSEIEREIDQTEETIERLQEEREELTDKVEEIEAEVEELEDEDHSTVLDLHKEANQLEYELGVLENDLDRVNEKIASIEDRLDEREKLADELDDVRAEIADLRTRIERIEEETIKTFNEHMDNVLEILEYDNLGRVWLERAEHETRDGRRKVQETVFELHVVRTTDSGAAYEDTVNHLSESEREVTGLVFALAGYLAHDVHEQVPFMLLDSLEAIDAERLSALVDYLREFSNYLFIALLPEDAQALSDEYARITEI